MDLPKLKPGHRFTLPRPIGSADALLLARLGERDKAAGQRTAIITSDASDAEVDQAYRRLISQYHPDKMAGVADELRRQAEKKAGEINAAYDRIKKLRKR